MKGIILMKKQLLISTLAATLSFTMLTTSEHVYASQVKSDVLARNSLLGIMPKQTGENAQVELSHVLPNSTAEALGLQADDIITKINDTTITNFQQLLSIVRPLKTDHTIKIEVQRSDKTLTFKGKMQPRPYEVSQYANVHYDAVSYQGNTLRNIIYTPKQLAANEKAPAIFFIQGYTCDSIDYGLFPNVTTRQMIDQFSQAGYVVYRIEKPGMGDSVSQKHCRDIDFTTESNAFLQGLKDLKNKPFVDNNNVFLWGHSLGVLHAPVIAKQSRVKGIIGYGGVLKQWHDYMVDIYQKQSVKHFSLNQKQADENAELVKPFLHLWLNTNTPWQEVVNDKRVQKALSANLLEINGEFSVNRHYSFFRDLNRYDFEKIWRELNIPVLMMHGSFDIQAIEPKWAFDIANLSNEQHSKALVIENAEHAFMRYNSQESHMNARQTRQYNPTNPGEHFDKRIGEQTLNWLAQFSKDTL